MAVLEQVPMRERYRRWVDAVAELFGGLHVCGVSALVDHDGHEFIYEVNDSSLALMGDTQEQVRTRRHTCAACM
jgi:hypothetical protein